MIKDPNCKNKHWKGPELDNIIDSKIHKVLQSPELVASINNKPKKTKPNNKNASVEKRIREIDKRINKLMDLYQQDGIPPELLGDKINTLYNERVSLQSCLVPVEEPNIKSFDLIKELLSDAAQVWDFSDVLQKRRILQSLVSKIILTDDKVEIIWSF